MTLALCAPFEEGVFLFSDLRLSYELDLNPVAGQERPTSSLKTYFLNRDLAIAYSNGIQAGHLAVTEARRLSAIGTSTADIAEFLRVTCGQKNGLAFLLADARNPVTIYKIWDGQLAGAQKGVFWIGDSTAAKLVLGADHHKNARALDGYFQEVLDSQRIPSVGGIVVTARGTEKGFKFVSKMVLTSPYYKVQADGKQRAVDWGNAAAGGFGYTTLVPVEPGQNGWGVHFFQGRLGYFFRVDIEQDIGERLVWHDTDLQNAIDALQKELGFAIEAPGNVGV